MIQKPSAVPENSETDFVFVSNSVEFFRIPVAELASAEADGYYRPRDRNMTIITDGDSEFEIPLADVDSAIAAGFKDLLAPSTRLVGSASAISGSTIAQATATKPISKQTLAKESVDELADLDEPTEEEIEQNRQLEESEGLKHLALKLLFWARARRAQLSQQFGGAGISVLIHLALILLLASFALITEEPEQLGFEASATSSDEMIDEVIIDPTPMDISEPTEMTESEAAPEAEELPMEMVAEAPDLSGAIMGEAIKPPAKPVVAVEGKAMDKPSKKPTFFGNQMEAINYVFVIDNSNSMSKGRFETALYELMLTVNRLTPKQRFYVIFYSDTAYPMMHPNPVKQLVAATDQNKAFLFRWLQTVPLCLKTQGKQAIQAAFDLNPDVIYILGDGAFTDKAADFFSARPHNRVIVHTRGMEVSPKNAAGFQKLARTHRGTYMDVGVSPQGALMAKQNPRPRNNTRGPVWGLALPLTKKR